MIVGTPTEIKDHEFRVGMVPAIADALVRGGHTVLLQKGAGLGSGIPDEEYVAAGAQIVETPEEIWERSEMVIKVKEPIREEYARLRSNQILFTFLHLAAEPELTRVLLERKVLAVAYETIELPGGSLPILVPMSEVAGRMSIQVGARLLERIHGGRGVLLSGLPGVPPADVVIFGAGIAGINAARIAYGMGARVTVLDIVPEKLRTVSALFQGQVTTVTSTPHSVDVLCRRADLLIGAVLVAGRSAPRIITREMLGLLKRGSVIVDISIDQGGCAETSRPTTHSNPYYEVDGVLHYCVTNIPGAVPRTSTFGLTNETFVYAVAMANHGMPAAIRQVTALASGVNTFRGHLTHRGVAESLNIPYVPLGEIIGNA
ncbi:MAG: alanine dehydrogenase [Candidatus Schekmanbacteria bacterium]|nr:alanine dehydrogenase [Candidatus Schekmanbacteria bacterium]